MTSSTISIITGNLAEEKADVLVNTIGTSGKLIQGSVSYAILEGGGAGLQTEITQHYPHGLKVGDIAQTSGGSLKCKKVFHIVLKQWVNVCDEAERLLEKTVIECLDWAVKQGFRSLAFPALGAGFHRFPAKRSAEIMFHTIEGFLHTNKDKSLKSVKIVLHPRDKHSNLEFQARKDGVSVVHENYLSRTIELRRQSPLRTGVKLDITVGCLSQLEADALVNTTQLDLQLSVGAVSRILLEKGGNVLQRECWEKHPHGIRPGRMVTTSGGNLLCKKVFHVVLSDWDEGKGDSKEILQSLVKKCLRTAAHHYYSSIGFPLLGTGYLGFPPSESAKLMLQALKEFLHEQPRTSITKIYILIAHKDSVIRQAVENSFGQESGPKCGPSMVASASSSLAGVQSALAGTEVKYFPIKAGCFISKSPEEQHFQTVSSAFYHALANDDNNRHVFELTMVEYIINPKLIKKFRSAQQKMSLKDKSYGTPKLGFHGTEGTNVKSICSEGFRVPDHEQFEESTDVGWYGNGIYLSGSARFAMNYMQKSNMLILCQVLQGKIFKCKNLKLGEPKEPGFDSHVDPFGKEMVLYDDDCILPVYIVHFKIRKRFKLKGDTYDPNENDDTELEYLNEMEMHKGEQWPGL